MTLQLILLCQVWYMRIRVETRCFYLSLCNLRKPINSTSHMYRRELELCIAFTYFQALSRLNLQMWSVSWTWVSILATIMDFSLARPCALLKTDGDTIRTRTYENRRSRRKLRHDERKSTASNDKRDMAEQMAYCRNCDTRKDSDILVDNKARSNFAVLPRKYR